MSNTSRRISNEKRHAPAPLQKLIELVNSVPASVALPSTEAEGTKILKLIESRDFARFRELIGGVKPDLFLRKLIGPRAPKTFNRVAGYYILLRSGREWLREIAGIGVLCPKYKPRGWTLPPIQLPMVTAQVDDRRKLHLNLGPIIDAIDAIDPCRIRICPVCQGIFWAARIDKRGCTDKCSGILRTRRWRRKHLEKYKPQRIKRAAEKEDSKIAHERERLARMKAPTTGKARRRPRLPAGPRHA